MSAAMVAIVAHRPVAPTAPAAEPMVVQVQAAAAAAAGLQIFASAAPLLAIVWL